VQFVGIPRESSDFGGYTIPAEPENRSIFRPNKHLTTGIN
jgi:hypothetical protein